MRWNVFLIVLLSIVFVSLAVYIGTTRQYPQWDEHHYLSIAVRTLDAVHEKDVMGFAEIIPISGSRQPAYSFIITLFLLVLGTSHTYKIALFLNSVFFLLSIVGTYLLARQFFGKRSSFLASFIFATTGNALFYAHFTYVETAVTTGIIWTLVFLKRSNTFQSNRYSFLTAVCFALATLTRFVAPIFLIAPVFLIVLQLLTLPRTLRNHAGKNIIFFLIVGLALPIVIYFIPNRVQFLQYVHDNQTYGAQWVAQYREASMANTFSTRSVMYYFNIIQQNTILPFLLFAGGMLTLGYSLIRAVIRKKITTELFDALFLFLCFVGPYAFFTFIAVWKEDRFLVPIYPAISILSAVFLEKIRAWRQTSLTIYTIVILVGGMTFFGSLFGVGPMGQKGLIDYVTPRWVPHPRRIYLTPLVWPPTKEYTNADQFVRFIEQDWKKDEKATVGITFNHEPFLNALTSILTYEKRNLAVLSLNQSATNAAQFDYLATSPELEEEKGFTKMTTITIPYDHSLIHLYKKKSLNY